MPLDEQVSNQFVADFNDIYHLSDESGMVKLTSVFDLLESVMDYLLGNDAIYFPSFFTKVSFLKQKLALPTEISYSIIHLKINYRHLKEKQRYPDKDISSLIKLGQHIILHFLSCFNRLTGTEDYSLIGEATWIFPPGKKGYKDSIPYLKGIITDLDENNHILSFKIEDEEEPVSVFFNMLHLNEIYTDTLIYLKSINKFPVTCMLLDIKINDSGGFYPVHFILEPDYLFDVTAISNCFELNESNALRYVIKKFIPYNTSIPLIIGDIANYFLDELISDSSQSFEGLFPKIFKKKPLNFAGISDEDLSGIIKTSKHIFINLVKTIKEDFPKQQIIPTYCYVEPSFISEKFGIQGRLDLLYEGSNKTVIIELKSGKTFQTNQYGINIPHFFQFLLYNLLIQSKVNKRKVEGFVLYAADAKSLRYAPVNVFEQQRALATRNELLIIETQLMALGFEPDLLTAGEKLIQTWCNKNGQFKGFFKRDWDYFMSVMNQASSIERKYFYSYVSFIAREQKLAKTGGNQDKMGSRGQAALWLDSLKDKMENADILNHLKLLEIKNNQLKFIKTDLTANRTKFRVGDTLVLYPSDQKEVFDSRYQIFKAYLIQVESNEIEISLLFPQHDDSFFRQFTFWNLEHDFFDSFSSINQSLFAFLNSRQEKRNLFLGLQAPFENKEEYPLIQAPYFSTMTGEQQGLLSAIIRSKDYFLLWGPPGTGKTSVMVRNLIAHYYFTSNESMLLVAFTNRAVDELCEAIESIGVEVENNYLRIGQVQSASLKYRKNILKIKIEKINTRKSLLKLLTDTRIFVCTVSSLQKNIELLSIKKIDRIIVDEASQLSDPSLAGILTQVPHFLLIGDHKQLPAVVLQPTSQSLVKDEELKQIGFYDLRDSVFERLIQRVGKMKWTWAMGRLSHQGRMHQEIMAFPGFHFYENFLTVLPVEADPQKKLTKSLPDMVHDNYLASVISCRRVCFFPSAIDLTDFSGKSNKFEAKLIVQIIQFLHLYYAEQELEFTAEEIGIITPYRAQIACIKEHLTQDGFDSSNYTIDTVERYQGSARSVIIYSPCLNYPRQLNTLISENREGIDRKLNVAITRSRSHFIMVGNPDLLKRSTHYLNLMKYSGFIL